MRRGVLLHPGVKISAGEVILRSQSLQSVISPFVSSVAGSGQYFWVAHMVIKA